jgi:hypothetical protein
LSLPSRDLWLAGRGCVTRAEAKQNTKTHLKLEGKRATDTGMVIGRSEQPRELPGRDLQGRRQR